MLSNQSSHQVFADWEVYIYRIICTEMHDFVRKNVYKLAKHGFASTSLCQRDSTWSGNTDSPVKKKIPKSAVSKKGHANSLLGLERTNLDWFHWKMWYSKRFTLFQASRQNSLYILNTIICIRRAFNKFPDFFVQTFKIVVDSWKFTILLLYILWDDWPIFMISGSNEQLQQQLEYTRLKPDCQKCNLDVRTL